MARLRRSLFLAYTLGCVVCLSLVVYSPLTDEVSAYTTHLPINITGDSGFNLLNGVVGGNGTEADPYVISGWDITSGWDRGIQISNTDAYFVISDCYIHDIMSYSVYLENAHNGTLTGNSVSSNYYGVGASYCENLVVSNNTISDTTFYGLDLYHCNGALVFGNSFHRTWFFGLVIGYCVGAVVQGNTFEDDGIEIWGNSLPEYDTHEIASNNTINGRPILYYVNQTDVVVDSVPVGELILVNCRNILATGLVISGPEVAVLSAYCYNETISGCSIANASYSIRFWDSDDIWIRNNSVLNAYNDHARILDPGMAIVAHMSEGILIESNVIIDSDIGAYLGSVSNVTFRRNTINLGGYGPAVGVDNGMNVLIQGNNLSDKDGSVRVGDSLNCTVVDNIMLRNNNDAFGAFNVTDMRVEGNSLTDNGFGMRMSEVYDVVISNNLVTGGGGYINFGQCGIDIETGANLTLNNNTVTNIPDGGVLISGVDGALLHGNTISSNFNDGVALFDSNNVRVLNNSIQFNGQDGILEVGVSGIFEIMGNLIMNNSDSGVLIWHGAEIAYNFIAYNDWFGIGLNSSGSLIHHNNIIGNLIQAYEDSVIANEWDNGYPDGGNYWSDYAGPDIMNGPDQDMLGSDGIGDTPRVVPMGREDKYPLMEPFEVNRPPVARFEVTPPVGDTSTVFEFNASSSWDYETSAGDLMFRWDWDGDGAWDTGWSSESTLTHQFATPGNYSVKLEVRDAGNTTGDFSLQVEVVEQIPELPTLFLPVMVTMLCLLILTYSSFARRRHRRGSD